ncbi:MAG: AI-2E family transporter [Aristaeellaceae bacterium]
MDKKLFKRLILLITYTVVLILVIVRFDDLTGLLGKVLGSFKSIFIGFAIAFVLNRPCRFFHRLYARGLKGRAAKLVRPLAVISAYAVLVLAIAAIIAFIVPQVIDSLELFLSNVGGYITQLQGWINALLARLDLEMLESLDLSNLSKTLQDLLGKILEAATSALPQLLSITSTVVSIVVTGVLAFVFSIYMLSGSDTLLSQCRRVIKAYLPERVSRVVFDVCQLTADTFTKFVSGQLIEACILGFLCFLGMTVLRLSYAPLIGVIVGVSALIPVAGAYLGAILSALLLVMVSPVQALTFLIFLVILQQVEGNLIYPRVVGTSVGLPGIWVLAAVTVGGSLFGFVGMLVSVPVASVLYTLLRRDVHRRLDEKE